MASDEHVAEETQVAQAQEGLGNQQAQEEQPQMSDVGWKAAIAERDEKIAALEQQVADAVKNAETAEALRGEIAELKRQSESDRIDFELQLAGVKSVKAARAVLDDHGGDVSALKEAEPWLFAEASSKSQGGRTGLPNAGTSSDEGKTLKRWRKLAGLDDSNDE